MEIRPILSTLFRNKTAPLLIAAQVALTLAIVCNALFIINDRLAQVARPSGVAEAELIDLRSIWPWDRATVLGSCARTRHLLVVHEAVQAGGFGAEIAATVAETVGCKVRRLGAPRIPVGYAPVLEAQSRVQAPDIAAAARGLLA